MFLLLLLNLLNSVVSRKKESELNMFLFLQPNPRDYMDDYHVSGVFYLIHERYLIVVKMVKTYESDLCVGRAVRHSGGHFWQ